MSKTVIFFIRHGEVENPQKIIYGRLPGFGISNNGKIQVKNTLLKLKNFPIKIIYTSPLLRAKQSARIFGDFFNLNPVVSNRLLEIRNIFQGTLIVDYKSKIQPFQFSQKYVKKGQESIESIANRMHKFLKLIKNKHQGKHIVAVSHGDPIAILKSVVDKKEFTWQYKLQNYLKTGDFYKLEFESR